MITFTTALTRANKRHSTEGFWVLRLYYDDETNFTGFSDQDRTLGGDIYYGLAQWNSYSQSLNIDGFRTSTGVFNVSIINADNTILGGRFSDLFATYGYVGRKWELFQSDNNAAWSEDNKIAEGFITSDVTHDEEFIRLRLADMWGKLDIEIPTQRADIDTFSRVPDKNLDKPIPMFYGDAGYTGGARAGSDFEKHLVKTKVPALIIDSMDADGNVIALPDTNQDANVVLNQINAKNIFLHINNTYLSCATANVTTAGGAGTDANPADETENYVKCTGVEWLGYFPFGLVRDTGDATITDGANMVDGNFTTSGNMLCDGGQSQDMDVQPPQVPKLGRGTQVDLLIDNGTVTGTPANVIPFALSQPTTVIEIGWASDKAETITYATGYSATELEDFDLADKDTALKIYDSDGADDQDIDINMLAMQVTCTPDMNYTTKQVKDRVVYTGNLSGGYSENYSTIEKEAPTELELVFIGGKGREYGAFIDEDDRGDGEANDNGADATTLNENPVYIIEDICRNELGLTSANLDWAGFDVAGNVTDGDIENTFGLDALSIKFVLSIYKLGSVKKEIEKICKQAGCYFWFGAGKAKIKARRRTYTAVVDTIDFNDIGDLKFSKTRLDNVKNYITVNYEFDYGAGQTLATRTPTENVSQEDSTSQGNTVDGYNAILKHDLDITYASDTATAEGIADAYLLFLKDQKNIIDFNTKRANYNHLEIGDIINFDNWDANLPVFGSAPTTGDGWMITKLQKFPDHCAITVTNVPGTIV